MVVQIITLQVLVGERDVIHCSFRFGDLNPPDHAQVTWGDCIVSFHSKEHRDGRNVAKYCEEVHLEGKDLLLNDVVHLDTN